MVKEPLRDAYALGLAHRKEKELQVLHEEATHVGASPWPQQSRLLMADTGDIWGYAAWHETQIDSSPVG